MAEDQKDQKKTRKAARPRLDAIVRHIVAGSYDDDLDKLQSAIDRRNQKLQGDLLERVKKVFGKDATVQTEPAPGNPMPRVSPLKPSERGVNPFLKDKPDDEDPELKAAQEAALAREAELAAEAGDALGTDDDEAGIESRSPVIGSVES